MTTNLSPKLQHLLEVVVGQPWPESDESGVREIGRAWSTFSDAITQISNDLKDSAGALPPHMRGATADAYVAWAGSAMQHQLNQLKQSADELSKMMINAAADIQKAKIMIIFQLVLLVATIAALIASLFGAFAIPGVIATARAIITALLQALALNLAMTLGMDYLIQLGQILNNQRDGFDWKSLEASALGGAVGGLLFGLGSVAGSFLRNGIAKLITNNLDAAIANPLAKIGGAAAAAGVQAPMAAVGSVITEAATGQRISLTAGMFTSAFLGSLNGGGGHGGGGGVDHSAGNNSGGDHTASGRGSSGASTSSNSSTGAGRTHVDISSAENSSGPQTHRISSNTELATGNSGATHVDQPTGTPTSHSSFSTPSESTLSAAPIEQQSTAVRDTRQVDSSSPAATASRTATREAGSGTPAPNSSSTRPASQSPPRTESRAGNGASGSGDRRTTVTRGAEPARSTMETVKLVSSGPPASRSAHAQSSRLPTIVEENEQTGVGQHATAAGHHVGPPEQPPLPVHQAPASAAAPRLLPGLPLPDFIRDGQALGQVAPAGVHGVADVTTQVAVALGGAKHTDLPQIAAALHGDFESFLGTGRPFPALVDGKPGEVRIVAHYESGTATPAREARQVTATTHVDMQAQGVRKTESTTVQSGPAEVSAGVSTMGMPHGALGSLTGTQALPRPATTSSIGAIVSDLRSSRGGESSDEHQVLVQFTIHVVDHNEGIRPGGAVTGSVELQVPHDLTQMTVATGAERPKVEMTDPQQWWRKADTFMPEAVTGVDGLFGTLRRDVGGDITAMGSPGRAELQRFASPGNVRAQLPAMAHDWVYSGELSGGHGSPAMARMRIGHTDQPVLIGTSDKLKMRVHEQSGIITSSSTTLNRGTDVKAGLGYGGTLGQLVNLAIQGTAKYGFRKSIMTSDGSTASQRQGYEINGKTSLYQVRTHVEVQVPGKPVRTVPVTSYVRLETPEAAELGLAVPDDTAHSPITPSATPRHPPPYLAAGVASGHVTVGRLDVGRRLNDNISASLRGDPKLQELLPRFDPPGPGTPPKTTAEQRDNQRNLATALSETNLSARMPTVTGPGLKVHLTHTGALGTDHVQVTIKARPSGSATHLGQSGTRKVRGSAANATKMDASGGSQRGGTIGVDARVTVGPGPWRLGPQGSVEYGRSTAWRNGGGPVSERISLNVGGATSHVFGQRYDFTVEITRVSQDHLTGSVTVVDHPLGQRSTVSADTQLWVPQDNTHTDPAASPHPDPTRPEGMIQRTEIQRPRDPSHLLTTPRPAPRILHVEAIAGAEQLRAAADSALTRASGGDKALSTPGSDAAKRLDQSYSPESLAAHFTRLITTALPAPGLRWNRRVRPDRTGAVALSATLVNPKLISVSDDMGTENSHKGGSAASDERRDTHGGTVSGGPAATSGTATTTAYSGLYTASAKWGKQWFKAKGSEISGTIERNRVTPPTGRTVLVRWDMDVTVSAQSRRQYAVAKWSKNLGGERVYLPGGAYVRMTEQEAQKHGLLADVSQLGPDARRPSTTDWAAPHQAPAAPHLPTPDARGYLGLSHVEPTVNLARMVTDLRKELGSLGAELLPDSMLNDTQHNTARLLHLTGHDSVTALVDDAFDGGVPLPLPKAGRLGVDGYRAVLTAHATGAPRHVDTAINEGETQNFITSNGKRADTQGTATSVSGGVRVIPQGNVAAPPDKPTGSAGGALGGNITKTDTVSTVASTADMRRAESRAAGPATSYRLPTVFTLSVLHKGTEIASVSSTERQLPVRLNADDVSTVDGAAAPRGVSRPLRLDIAHDPNATVEAWQRNTGHPQRFDPPPRFTPEGFVGAKEIHEAAGRALRAAGVHPSFMDDVAGSGIALSNSAMSSVLRAHLPRMNRPEGWRLPDLHEQAAVFGQDVKVTLYSRMHQPRLAGLSDSVNLEYRDSQAPSIDNQASSSVSADITATAPVWRAAPPTGTPTTSHPIPAGSPTTSGGVDVRGGSEQGPGVVGGASGSRMSNVKPYAGRSVGVASDLDVLVVAEVRDRLTGRTGTAAYEVSSLGGAHVRMSIDDAPAPFRDLPVPLRSAQDALTERAKAWQEADSAMRAGEHRIQDRALRGETIRPDQAAADLDRARQDAERAAAQVRRLAEQTERAAGLASARRDDALLAEQYTALLAGVEHSAEAEYRDARDRLKAAAEAATATEHGQRENLQAARDAERRAAEALSRAEQTAVDVHELLAAQAELRRAAQDAKAAWFAAKAVLDQQRAAFQPSWSPDATGGGNRSELVEFLGGVPGQSGSADVPAA